MTENSAFHATCLTSFIATLVAFVVALATGLWGLVIAVPFVAFTLTAVITGRFIDKPKPASKRVVKPVELHYDPQSGEWRQGNGDDQEPQLVASLPAEEDDDSIVVNIDIAVQTDSGDNAAHANSEHATTENADNTSATIPEPNAREEDDLDYNEPPEEDDLDLNLNIGSDYDELDADDEILDEEEYNKELERYLAGSRRNKRRLRRLRHYLMDH